MHCSVNGQPNWYNRRVAAICYVCGSTNWDPKSGSLRDAPSVGVKACSDCGLVIPDAKHPVEIDYASGSMHGSEPLDVAQSRIEGSQDDLRRVRAIFDLMNEGETILDIGCGAGGFIHGLKLGGVSTFGLELDETASAALTLDGFCIWPQLENIPESVRSEVRIVTMFHVLEHLQDPRVFLRRIRETLHNVRLLVVEIPCSEDPLLTLYESQAFSHFTYWSHHEHLHSKRSLELLLSSVFDSFQVKRLQRYGLGNHLSWLAIGKPGGQARMSWAEGTQVDVEYRSAIIAQGFSDSLWAVCKIE